MIGNIIIKFLERYLVIFTSAILRHTCTPNVSPHGPLRTVLHIHVYGKTYNLYRSWVFRLNPCLDQEAFITQSTWSQIVYAAMLL